MKIIALASLLLACPAMANDVAPALEQYRQQRVLGEVWKRPQLSARDRGIVTLAALISRQQTTEMPFYLNLALDNGVKPREVAEMITHLAFYAGWGNAASATALAKDVFAQRKIGADQLPQARPTSSSAICGCGRIWRRATGASSR